MENEKFKVGVPVETYVSLKRDAEQFEIYRDGTEINMNGFLSALISNYYRKYKLERSGKFGQILGLIAPWIHAPGRAQEITEKIMEEIVLPAAPARKDKKPERLAVTPTRETDGIITKIKETEGKHYAQYLCRMFMNYCEEPFHERERIIFSENADFLAEACQGRQEITFTTKNKPGVVHHVIPYDLAVGTDEMNNYLLCQEYNKYGKRNEAKSYRLCRILNPDYSETSGSLEENVIRNLEKMKKHNPQYAITEDSDICVRLTPAGQKSYQQIYFARPIVQRVAKLVNGDAYYYFSAASDLVFRFVIRFNPGEAEVVSPPELRERVYRHFRDSAVFYEKG